jgi:hypothetical protein
MPQLQSLLLLVLVNVPKNGVPDDPSNVRIS